MENASYTTLTRQSGLMREMRIVANNIANAATAGYRQEGMIFSEYVQPVKTGPSLSMANGNVRHSSMLPGGMVRTGGRLDMAIDGAGFFRIETPAGERLSRAGNFALSAAGDLVTQDGFAVLDTGGAPVFIPPDADDLGIAADGTISSRGRPLAQIGLGRPVNPSGLIREDGVMFRSEDGIEPGADSRVLQGFLEQSNVDPVGQIARMIEVQRAYEMGQRFLENEDRRIRDSIETFKAGN